MAVARRWPRAIRASVGNVKYVLAQRDIPAERQRGTEMLAEVHDLCLQQRYFRIHLPAVEICAARERFRVGDFGEAIPAMRQAVDELFRGGQVVQGIWGAAGFAEALLKRGAKGDVVEAQEVIDNLAKLPDDVSGVVRDIRLLRLRALLAQSRGDESGLPRISAAVSRDGDVTQFRGEYAVGRGDGVTESVLSGGQRRSSGNWAYARTMPHCVAARARIHYEVDGEGEPLVLIAGTAFDLSFWDDLLPELRGFRVLRLDNRGAGLSDAPDEAFSIEQMADDVAAVMDAAGMPSAHVYGMSMGGLIAQDLAIRYPERVLSLVLGATYAGGPPLSRAVRLLPLLLSEKGPEDLLRATAPFLSATPIPATADRFPGHALAPRDKRGLRRQLSAQLRYNSIRRLHTIRQPTLIMHGERDRLISPLNARRMTRRIPGARLRLIAGAGHMYRHDRPGESHDLLLDFLMEAAGRLLDQEELQLKREQAEARRIDGTVLITDIVRSTEHAARLGDDAWDRLLGEHDTAVHTEIDHHKGILIKMTGDGALALFESAVDACRCALAIRGRIRCVGMEVRAGVHTGSFLVSGDDLHGLGLHIAARVMASAIDGGVRVTAETVASLGAVVSCTHPIGPTTLRGIPGEWDLYELDDFAIH